jgi:hypothetical protein
MAVRREASALGGRTTYARRGREHMRLIGELGRARQRELLAAGRIFETAHKSIADDPTPTPEAEA